MNHMFRLVSFLIVLGIFSNVEAQNLFKLYKKAEDSFYAEDFAAALPLYQEIQELDTAYEDVNYKVEIARLLSDRQYSDIQTFLDYEEVMARRDKFYYYWKGRIQLEEYQFEEARQSLDLFINSPARKSEEVLQEARRWSDWSLAAQKFMDNPEYFEIHLLEQGINTNYAELSPVFFADKEELLFLSNRNDRKPDEFQIYHTVHEGSRSWSEPKPVYGVGTFTRENSNIEVVDEDGRLFQFRKNKGGDLFYSEPTEDKDGWSRPQEFDSKISSTHLSSHFFINEHEDRIIFAKAVGKKKDSNLDLFQSYRNHETGEWSKPALFATTINSEFNEDSPYLSPDEQTLYFASDGHETMGGYDIFKSTYDSVAKKWSEPINLGFPINSPDDEMHFKLNPDQMSGYFTSNRLNTFGDYDIFFFWEIHTVKMTGRVIDGPTGELLKGARLYLRPVEYTDMYFYSAVDNDGKYEVEITSDDVFNVEVKMPDGSIVELEDFEIHATGGATTTYLKDFYVGEAISQAPTTSNVNVPSLGSNPSTPTSSTSATPPVNRPPVTPTQGTRIQDLGRMQASSDRAIVRNIYFDFGNTKVTDESLPTLNAIKNLMTGSPRLRIEIAGHTDNIGDDDVNQWVSQQRANTVKKWLVENGISEERMKAVGYGETRPMATNDDEFEGRELNRRIEIIVR